MKPRLLNVRCNVAIPEKVVCSAWKICDQPCSDKYPHNKASRCLGACESQYRGRCIPVEESARREKMSGIYGTGYRDGFDDGLKYANECRGCEYIGKREDDPQKTDYCPNSKLREFKVPEVNVGINIDNFCDLED